MDFLLEALTNWLKEMLVGGIMGNLSGMFDSVNQQVGDISVQVGQTPQGWNGGIFSMIQNLSNSIMVPIAGVILAIVMTLELIQMITDKNNLHDVDTWMIFKWVFKSATAILLVTNTWNIVMGVFDMAQSVVAQASGIISSDTAIDISSILTDMEPRLMEMDLGPLFGLWFQSMFILITFIKLLAVFDLLVIAVYFGSDILSTVWSKFRKKPTQEEPFDFSLDAAAIPLSIDSIRQLYSGDAADFVEETLLPDAAQTMAVLTDREQTAARLLLSALVGFLAEEAPMDERNFPMVMELLNCMEGEKEDGCQDPVDILFEETVRRTRRHEEYYSNYQRYRLLQVDKTRVILACRILINDLLGKLYRYDYRFGYDLLLDEENSIEKKLHTPVREEWEDEDDETCDC